MTKQPIRSRTAFWILLPLTLIAALLLAAIGFLYAPAGESWLEAEAERRGEARGWTVAIDRLSLSFPLQLRAERMLIRQRGQTLGEVTRLSLKARLSALMTGRIALDHIAADSIRLENQPTAAEKSQPADGWWISTLSVDAISVDHLQLLPSFLGTAVDVSVRGQARWTDRERRLAVTIDHRDGSGTLLALDASFRNEIRLSLTVDDPEGILLQLAGLNGHPAALAVDLDLRGTPQRWAGTLHARLSDDIVSGLVEGGEGGRGQNFALGARVESATRLPNFITARWGNIFAIDIEGAFDRRAVVVRKLRIAPDASPDTRVTAQAIVSTAPLEAQADVQLYADNLDQRGLAGINRFAASVSSLRWQDGRVQPGAYIVLQIEPREAPNSLRGLDTVTASARLAATNADILALSDLTIESIAATLRGEAEYRPAANSATVALSSSRIDGNELGRRLGIDIADGSAATLQASLRNGELSGELTAAAERVAALGLSIGQPRILMKGYDLLGKAKIALDARGALTGGPLLLQASILKAGENWRVEDIGANLAGTRIAGDFSILEAGILRGALDLVSPDIEPLAQAFAFDIGGGVNARAVFSDIAGRQRLELEGNGQALRHASLIRIGTAAFSAAIDDVLGRRIGSARVDMRDVTTFGERLNEANLDARLEGDRLDVATRIRAPDSERLTLDGAAAVLFRGDAVEVELSRLSGMVFEQLLSMERMARLEFAPGRYSVDMPRLRVGSGTAGANLTINGEAIDASFAVSSFRIPLDLLSPNLPRFALLNGTGQMQGSLAAPRGEAILVAVAAEGVDGTVRLKSEVALRDRAATINAALSANGASLALNGTFQLAEGLRRATWTSPQSTLALMLTGRGEVSQLDAFLPIGEDRIGGAFEIDGTVGGTLADPRPRGRVTLARGRYENAAFGTVLDRLELQASGDSSGLRLDSLQATDGATGTIAAQGDWPFAEGAVRQAAIRFDRFRLVRRDDIVAAVSGTLGLGAGQDSPILKGELAIETATVNLAETPTARLQAIEVIEIPSPALGMNEVRKGAASSTLPLQLDIQMRTRGPLFVRGRGLESTWGGNVAVTGPLDDPQLRGSFTVERGEYRLLGQRLAISRGVLTMTGGPPRAAQLDVASRTVRADTTLEVSLSGPVSEPSLAFSSTPPLPSEEILARLLFGQTRVSLGPVQAIQLADAARSLAGVGGSASLTERFRDVFGLATFDIGTNEEGNTEVRAGSYIGRGVYLGLQRDTGSGDGAATLEVDVTRNVTVDTTVGTTDEREFGINWKRDY